MTKRKTLLAIAAMAAALPVAAYFVGFLSSQAPETGLIDSAQATVGPAGGLPAGRLADSPRPPIEDEPQVPQPIVHTVAVENGDNLMAILVRAGAARPDAHSAIQSLGEYYDPRRDLRVGYELRITLGPVVDEPSASGDNGSGPADAVDYVLAAVKLPVSYNREVEVGRDEGGDFVAREIEVPLKTEKVRVAGTIDSSLFINARNAGLPVSVLVELIRIYSFDVDFQRDIWAGDSFEVMYEHKKAEDGTVVHNGDVLYARLRLRGTELPLFRYETSDGTLDYFNEKGESVRKALLKTPIDGARLSSGFGNRKHPILGFTRLHRGTDFAAPTGTPIYAAGDGTVVEANVKGGYGKYIRIRHNGTYQTAYAHLNGYARGVRRGARVRQGQVIGYVGTTGVSTGPHLHYEVIREGRHVDPMGLDLPSGKILAGKELEGFQLARAALEASFAALADDSDRRVAHGSERDACPAGQDIATC